MWNVPKLISEKVFFSAKGFVTYYCSASLLSSIFMRRLSDIWPSDCENAKMTFAGLDLANKLLCISFAYVLQWSLHHFIHCAICQKFQSNVDFFWKAFSEKSMLWTPDDYFIIDILEFICHPTISGLLDHKYAKLSITKFF